MPLICRQDLPRGGLSEAEVTQVTSVLEKRRQDADYESRREASEGTSLADTLISNFQPPELGENTCLVLVPWFVVLCYGSLGKLRWSSSEEKKENAPFPLSPLFLRFATIGSETACQF